MNLIRLLRDVDRSLLIGIGGGGDIVSTLPIGLYFESLGIKCIYSGVVWERFRRDPKPGPRSVNELLNSRKISETLCYVNADTRIRTEKGLTQPIVSIVSEYLGKEVVGVDITKPEVLRSNLSEFVSNEEVDLVVGVDAGGDVLARGNEKRLVSPLADSIMLYVLKNLPVRSLIAITGFGSDGELTRMELEKYLSEFIEMNAIVGCNIITKDVAEEVIDVALNSFTESSKVPVISAMGRFGFHEVWDGNKIFISTINALVFYLDAKAVYERSPLARLISRSEDIVSANEKLNTAGIKTELDLELELDADRKIVNSKSSNK